MSILQQKPKKLLHSPLGVIMKMLGGLKGYSEGNLSIP